MDGSPYIYDLCGVLCIEFCIRLMLHLQALDVPLAKGLEAVRDILGVRVEEGAVRQVPSKRHA